MVPGDYRPLLSTLLLIDYETELVFAKNTTFNTPKIIIKIMAPILRSVTFNGSPAASLADLTSDEVRSFTDLKIETLTDLMLLEPNDFDDILGNDSSTFIKRKRLVCWKTSIGRTIINSIKL